MARNEPLRCPKCGRMVPDNELICQNCWTVLPINTNGTKSSQENESDKDDSTEIFLETSVKSAMQIYRRQ